MFAISVSGYEAQVTLKTVVLTSFRCKDHMKLPQRHTYVQWWCIKS